MDQLPAARVVPHLYSDIGRTFFEQVTLMRNGTTSPQAVLEVTQQRAEHALAELLGSR